VDQATDELSGVTTDDLSLPRLEHDRTLVLSPWPVLRKRNEPQLAAALQDGYPLAAAVDEPGPAIGH